MRNEGKTGKLWPETQRSMLPKESKRKIKERKSKEKCEYDYTNTCNFDLVFVKKKK